MTDWAAVDALVARRLPARAVPPSARREAVVRLTRAGWGAHRIAEHLDTTWRTVFRHRAAARAAGDLERLPQGPRWATHGVSAN